MKHFKNQQNQREKTNAAQTINTQNPKTTARSNTTKFAPQNRSAAGH